MIYNGDNGEIELLDDHLVLRRRGVQGRLAFGKDVPERTIPLQAVKDVRYKPAGRIGNGWLRLVLGDDDVPADFKPKNDDVDTVTFVPKHKDAWDQLHTYLQGVGEQNRAAGLDTGAVDYDRGHNATDKRNEKQQAAAEGQQAKAQEKAQAVEAKFLAEGVRADIAAAVSRMGTTFGGKREVRRLEQLMYDSEQVRELATGKVGDKVGIVALTDQRLLFYAAGLISQDVEEFPLKNISSVATSGGILGKLKVHASGNNAVIENMAMDRMNAIARAIRAGEAPAAAPAAAPAQPDVMDQLKKLGELRDAGILSEEEFTAKKADLLSRL